MSTFSFYLIFVPSIATVLMKLMYVSSSSMQITGGMERMDQILAAPELLQTSAPQRFDIRDIAFDSVTYSYTGQQNRGAGPDHGHCGAVGRRQNLNVHAVVGGIKSRSKERKK